MFSKRLIIFLFMCLMACHSTTPTQDLTITSTDTTESLDSSNSSPCFSSSRPYVDEKSGQAQKLTKQVEVRDRLSNDRRKFEQASLFLGRKNEQTYFYAGYWQVSLGRIGMNAREEPYSSYEGCETHEVSVKQLAQAYQHNASVELTLTKRSEKYQFSLEEFWPSSTSQNSMYACQRWPLESPLGQKWFLTTSAETVDTYKRLSLHVYTSEATPLTPQRQEDLLRGTLPIRIQVSSHAGDYVSQVHITNDHAFFKGTPLSQRQFKQKTYAGVMGFTQPDATMSCQALLHWPSDV